MAALKGGAIQRFIASPPDNVDAVLVYGPDAGLVRERVQVLAKTVTPDLKDPFNAIEFTDPDLKSEPARLADEASALSFLGGRRSIRVRTVGDGAFEAAKRLVDGLDGGYLKANALTVIEAGDLNKSSRLRKLFDAAKRAVSLPCYEDKPEDIAELAKAMAHAEELSFEPDALAFAVSLLGADRGVSRSEIEKVILFAGPKGTARSSDLITLEDVRTCLVDGESDALFEVAAAAVDGDPGRLSVSLRRLASAGGSDVGLVRAMQREVGRLLSAQTAINEGKSTKDAMSSLRPPVFYNDQRQFAKRLSNWSRSKLLLASDMLLEAEVSAKSTGLPARAIVERTALRLSVMGRRPNRSP